DDVGDAVLVHVAGGHVDAAAVAAAVGPEAPERLRGVLAAEDLDHRLAGRPADDQVGEAVAVEVAGGHADATGPPPEGTEVVQGRVRVGAAEDLDPGRAAGGAGNQVRDAVVVDVADSDADPAAVAAGEGPQAVQFGAGGGVVDRDQWPADGAD